MAERVNVFISSTRADLSAYRDAVTNVVLRLGMHPIIMEAFNPTDSNALQLCYEKIQEADVFIGIYAHRYGYAPDSSVTYQHRDGIKAGDGKTSITHLEYQWALELNLPMRLFVVSELDDQGNPLAWPTAFIEDEPGKTHLADFKRGIMRDRVVGFFYSPDNLGSQVATGLNSIIQPQSDGAHTSAKVNVNQALTGSGTQIGYAEIVNIYGSDAPRITGYLRQVVEEYGPLRDSYIDLEGTAPPVPKMHSSSPFDNVRLITPVMRVETENRSEPVESLQAALDAHQRLVMLGDPGAGKTTSLRVLLANAAERHLADPQNHPLPLLLELGAWPSEAPTLYTYIERHLKTTLPMGSKLLLLLDGLNEMGGESRESRIDSIRQYLREFSLARVIITCREKDYTDSLALGLPKLQVAELDNARVQKLLKAYLPGTCEALWNAIQPESDYRKERALLELARNPYLLTILTYIFYENGHLPENKALLFEQLVALRWEHEKQTRGHMSFDLPTLKRALGYLAFAMIDGDKGTIVSRTWVAKVLGEHADALIQLGEACSLLVDSGEQVRFKHQLMQEYFAASVLKFADRRIFEPVFRKWGIRETHLDETILTFCELDNSKDRIRKILDINPYLLSSFRKHLGEYVDDELVTHVIKKLCVLSDDVNPHVRVNAVFTLGQLPQESITSEVITSLQKRLEDQDVLDPWTDKCVWDFAAEALYDIGTDQALTVLREHGLDHLFEQFALMQRLKREYSSS